MFTNRFINSSPTRVTDRLPEWNTVKVGGLRPSPVGADW